jgi:N-acyl-D-aspartate/D-glutamate deacylase
VNAGFLVGHSALRRFVLGADANHRSATADELDRLRAALGDALAQGALGLSTDVSHSHSDGNGDPVPARGADSHEILALCEETGRWPGTTLEGIFDGASDGFSEQELELLPQMSVRANRPLNWNLLVVDAKDPRRIDRHLAVSHRARRVGGRVVALTMPVIVPMNMSFLHYCALNLMPDWGPIMNAPVPERIQQLRDPATRRMMVERANSDEAGMFRRLADFPGYVIGDTFSAANEGLAGRVVRDIAAERGDADPFDTLVDIVLTDDLRTVLWPSAPDDDDAHWALRRALWDDPDVFLGGSDAGAHLDRMCGGSYPTQLLEDTLRGRALVSLEWAVHALTAKPAELLGLRDRGTVTEGARADLVVFDPRTVGAAPATLTRDLPGGAPRLVAGSRGVVRVYVNGIETVVDGEATGARPGTVLRSGTDTDTVVVH